MTIAPIPFLGGFSQVAYITTDIDRAVALFGERYGVARFAITREVPFDPATRMDMALAYSGTTMLEIIAARGNGGSLYEIGMPATGFALQFHHFGHVVESIADWNRLRERVAAGWLPIAIAREDPAGDFPFMYLDARAELGHFIEYSLLTPARRAMYASIPRN
ncbi:MAG: VOC family protein [Gammaproteobacteria bacterium]